LGAEDPGTRYNKDSSRAGTWRGGDVPLKGTSSEGDAPGASSLDAAEWVPTMGTATEEDPTRAVSDTAGAVGLRV
jgi:hypothetical protein